MDADRRNRVSDLYHRALERPTEERQAFVHELCAGDEALREDVESLLQYEPARKSFLETPAAQMVAGAPPERVEMLNRQLGPYTVVAPLGVGGMGEVYRAHDSKLGRDVAIKILSSHLMDDPERRARFTREARLLATLNHPHIGAIYGLEESNGLTALVLELVEGDTLANVLGRAPLPVPQALAIARQIAEALDAAHQKGIVHRDLKPANIVLRGTATLSPSDVRAKVLDFGLAKAMTPGLGDDSAQRAMGSVEVTAEGRILGTAAYMSPEQVRGLAVDKRTDIWAFGCVLFEMLTGRPAFVGVTPADTFAHILEREPDWTLLPPETPSPLRTMLERCLRKDPDKRLHDIADARIEIDEWPIVGLKADPGSTRGAHVIRAWLAWVLIAAITTIGWIALTRRTAVPFGTAEPVEVPINTPHNSRFAGFELAISPDGRHIAFVATSQSGSSLWVRSLKTFEPREIPDTKGARSPFWSPDSRTIAYFQDGSLKTVPVNGGPPFTVNAAGPQSKADSAESGAWNRNDIIVFGPFEDGRLYRISAKGGSLSPVTAVRQNDRSHRWPSFLDDGQHFLYLAGETEFELRVGSLTSEAAESIGRFESHAAYAAGHLFFVRGGNLMAQRFDQEARKLLGEPIDLARRTGIEPHNQHGMFSVSGTGRLMYQLAARTKSQLTRIDRSGSPQGIVGEPGVYLNLDLSPDGQRVAVSRMVERGDRSEFDIWTIELSTGNATRLTDDYPAWQFDPTWSPDGSRLAFNERPIPTRGSFGLSSLASDGRGGAESLVPPNSKTSVGGPDWSPGNVIVYHTDDGSTAELWTMAMSGDRKPRLFLDTKYREKNGTLSPDGRWLAHQSNGSGRDEVIVRPFPAKEPSQRISRDGGMHPAWRRDGKELFFLAPDGTMMTIGFDPRTGRQDAKGPQKLFATQVAVNNNHPYAVTADGQRFLVPVPVHDPPRLVLDWRARVPIRN